MVLEAHRPTLLSFTIIATTCLALSACQYGSLIRISSGTGFLPLARTSLAEDGTVLAAKATSLVVGNGTTLATLDLTPHQLQISVLQPSRPARIRNGGEIALIADHTGVAGCSGPNKGAYHLDASGATLSTYFENCPSASVGVVGRDIGFSPNGTVAFTQISNGLGAIYRGPAAGPVSILRSGNGTFYNTGGLDVSDAGRVAVQMEYSDGIAGGLMRGILLFDTPEQDKSTVYTAIEKLSVGAQPLVAVNASGDVAFSLNEAVAFTIAGTSYSVGPGVFRATPTLFNTAKAITPIVDASGPYCRFGAVDINDSGTVVFEAAIAGGARCTPAGTVADYDGLFKGPSSITDRIVFGDESRLGTHQHYDSVRLGEINNSGQVAFLTEARSHPVDPVAVWRWSPM